MEVLPCGEYQNIFDIIQFTAEAKQPEHVGCFTCQRPQVIATSPGERQIVLPGVGSFRGNIDQDIPIPRFLSGLDLQLKEWFGPKTGIFGNCLDLE